MQTKTKKSPLKKNIKLSKSAVSQKSHSQQFLKVYWPYIPMFILVFMGLTFGYNWRGTTVHHSNTSGVLAYATEMSTSGLLNSTNEQRAQNGGLPALALNAKLASAAKAKANDMVARDYWSHNTPDGKEPWSFIDAAGYQYQKAGENLAYGFNDSYAVQNGWMLSEHHRENVLDPAYKEVGFGFANAPSYVGTGEQTVVVALYGNPANQTVAVNIDTRAPNNAAVKAANAKTAPAAIPVAVADTVTPNAAAASSLKKLSSDRFNQAITTDSPVPAAQPAINITRLNSLTGSYSPWSSAALSITLLIVVGLWTLKHVLIVKRVLIDGEQFLLHHPLIDVAVLSIVAIAILLSQSSGVIK